MFYTRCLYCDEEMVLEDQHLGHPIKCHVCHHFFDAEEHEVPVGVVLSHVAERTRQDKWQSFAGLATKLILPHACRHCPDPIEVPTGQRRSAITCPNCGRKTSLFSVLFKCPRCFDFLESPETRSGEKAKCPDCAQKVTIPFSVLQVAGESPSSTSTFLVGCPSDDCGRQLQTEQQHVGKTGVCPSCYVVFPIPRHGQAIPRAIRESASYSPQEALHRGKNVVCPKCEMTIPGRAGICPFCSANS